MKKNILVLGAAGRIGLSLVKNLANKNFNIIAVDKETNELKLLKFKNIIIKKIDLTKIEKFEKFLHNEIKFAIDTIIYAAYPQSKNWNKKKKTLNFKELCDNFILQLALPLKLSEIIIKYFLKKKKGNLIHISSILGVRSPKFEHYVGTSVNNNIEYTVIKSGIISLTQYLAKKYMKKNIKVNCVSPGGIYDGQDKKFVQKYQNSCGKKGLLSANDLNGVFEFLISEKSRYINGQNLIVDDGWSL